MTQHIVTTGCALLAVFSFYLGSTATSGTKRPGHHASMTGCIRGIITQSTLYAFSGLLMTIAYVSQMLSHRETGGDLMGNAPGIPLVIGLSVYLTMCISIPACRIYRHIDRQERTFRDADEASATAEQTKIRGRIAPNDTGFKRACTTKRGFGDIMINANG